MIVALAELLVATEAGLGRDHLVIALIWDFWGKKMSENTDQLQPTTVTDIQIVLVSI